MYNLKFLLLSFFLVSAALYAEDDDLPEGYSYCSLGDEDDEKMNDIDKFKMSILKLVEPMPQEGELARSLLEGGPSAVVAGCINAISGDFYDSEVDFVIPGIEPLAVERNYSSSTKKWNYRHIPALEMAPSKNGKYVSAVYQDDTGFGLFFRDKVGSKKVFREVNLSSDAFKKGLTNTSAGEISGNSNWKNYKLLLVENAEEKRLMMKTGGGVRRIFKRYKKNGNKKIKDVFFGKFELASEFKPNGSALHYEYKNIIYGLLSKEQLSGIKVFNTQKELISELFCIQEKERKVWRNLFQEVHQILDNNDRISRVNCSDRPSVSYEYDQSGRMIGKILPNGRFLRIDYFDNGDHKGKVHYISSTVDTDGKVVPTHYFSYAKDFTIVTDALRNKTTYSFNPKTKRLEYISQAGRKEKFVWAGEASKDAGHLLERSLQFAGKDIFTQKIRYDDFGNIISETLKGNLTGSSSEEQYVKNYKASQDGKNLPLEENDGRKWIKCAYHDRTRQLAKRFTGSGSKIYKREFFAYDKYGAVCQEILDDGVSEDEQNFSGVTERHLKLITNTQSFPFGLPEIVEERYLDKETGSYLLLKKTVFTYSPKGKVIEEKHYDSDDLLAYKIFRTFDAFVNLLEESDPLGYVKTYAYDSLGNKIAEENPIQKKKYHYDHSNRLIKEEELGPNGEWLVTCHTYDRMGHRLSTVDPVGDEARFEYDEFGRIVKKTLFLEEPCVELFAYDAMGNISKKTDANGNSTAALYTVRGQPYSIAYPDGSVEEKSYSLDGLLVEERAKNGLVTSYEHDLFGNIIRKTTGAKQTSALYSAFHLLKEIDEEGLETLYEYDGAGRLITKSKGDKKISYTYDSLGKERTVTEGDRVVIKFYDLKGQVLEERVESKGGVLISKKTCSYDFLGNVIKKQIGDIAHETTFTPQGRPLEEKDAKGTVTKYLYDYSNKYQVTKIDPLGVQEKISYNGREDIIQIERFSPQGDSVQKEKRYYDKAGHHIRSEMFLADEVRVTEWQYDTMGQQIATIEAVGTPYESRTDTIYNLFGQKEKLILPSGKTLHYSYDEYSRLIELSSSDGTVHYSYRYDVKDRELEAIDFLNGTSTRKTYDQHGRIASEQLANHLKLEFSYTLLDLVSHIALPDGTSIEYDYEGGRLKAVRKVKDGTQLYAHLYLEHNTAGQVVKEHCVDGQSFILRNYDANGRLQEFTGPQFLEQIGYDLVGNPISRTVKDASGSHRSAYAYDSLYQLLSEEGDSSHHYAYDALYNRTAKDTSPYQINALNQIQSAHDINYTYDLDGNLTEKLEAGEKTTYKYDALSRLISTTKNDITTNYTYDAAHRRISKQSQNTTTSFLYEGENEIGAYSQGRLTELRLLGNTLSAEIGASIALELEGKAYMPLHDASGNLVQLTNLTSKATESTQFTAFGESDAVLKSPWLYSSKRFDPETGFYYFGRRYFDPQIGRWISKDPLGFADGLNLYAYVHNQPLTHIDPDGQFAFLIPIALSMAAEYAVPFAAVALQEAGYVAAAAFVTGALQGYNGSYFEDTPLGELDPVASNFGKVLGTALSLVNPRKAGTNIARSVVAKEASVAATNVVKKKAANWTSTGAKTAAADVAKKTKHVASREFVKESKVISKNIDVHALDTIYVTPQGVALPSGSKYKIPPNYHENRYRAGSYGDIIGGEFEERLRIDPATLPGKKGPNYSHYHLNGKGTHYSPRPGDQNPGFYR